MCGWVSSFRRFGRWQCIYFHGQAPKEECIFLAKFYCVYINGEMGRTCSTCIWKKEMHLHRLGRLLANTASSTEYTRSCIINSEDVEMYIKFAVD